MSKSRQGGSYEGRRGHGKGFKRCPECRDCIIRAVVTVGVNAPLISGKEKGVSSTARELG